jgi:osmoprotectant transport system permease protein
VRYEQEKSLVAQFLLAASFIAASFALPLYEIRPNRIAGGVDIFWGDLSWLSLLVFCVLVLALFVGFLFKKGLRPVMLPMISLVVFCWVIVLLGPSSAPEVAGDRLARISPGLGSLFLLLAALVPFLDPQELPTKQKWGPKHLALLMIIPLALILFLSLTGQFSHLGFIKEWAINEDAFFLRILGHLRITAIALALSLSLGPLLAYWAYQSKTFNSLLQPVLNITQTIPSLVFFGFFMTLILGLQRVFPILGEWGIAPLGDVPVILALAIYALFPITKNSLVAFRSVNPGIVDAARGMGFTSREIWLKIRLPLALPILLGGVRIAIIQILGSAVLAKLISGDGLGYFIIEGLNSKADDMVILGVLTLLLLTFLVDFGFQVLQRLFNPMGQRQKPIPPQHKPKEQM